MILTTLLFQVEALACDDRGLRDSLSAVENAFRAWNLAREGSARGKEAAAPGERALADLRGALGCLEEPVSPSLAARIHGADALVAWLAGDRDRGVASLSAMLSADPGQQLSLELVPAAHELRSWMEAAGERPAGWNPSLRRWSLVDGIPSRAVPTEQPYVLQRAASQGQLSGRWVPAGSSSGARSAWLAGGAALLAGAAGSYAGAWAVRSAYWDAVEAEDDERIGSLHATTNALSIGAVGAGALGLVSVTVGFTR